MEYTVVAALALEAALLAAVATGVAARRSFWLGLAAFLALTALADSGLVAVGVFGYDRRFLSGITIGRAPFEDLFYGGALYGLAMTAYAGRWRPGDVKLLIRSARPYSWPNTALPALACGLAAGRLTPGLALGVLYFLGPYNLLLYGVNDVFDYESDRRNPRKGGAIEGAVVAPGRRSLLWAAITAANLPLLLLLAATSGAVAGLALATTVLVALAYSAPPLRTKEVAGVDSLTSSLHFVLPAVCGGLLAGASLAELPWRFLVAFLLWGAASQALGAIQDVAADRAGGIGSIAVSLGPRRTAATSLLLYCAAALVVASAGGPAVAAAAALLPYPLLAGSVLFGDPERQARRAWRGFLGMNLLSGFLVTQVLLHAWGVGRVTVADLLAWGTALGVLALLAIFTANQRRMRRSGRRAALDQVTVVIPARDEEERIGRCLAPLPKAVEVIVVDDNSRDRTAAVARAAGARVVAAGARPPGWTGKCWACWRGAQAASRDLIVFLDADTTAGRPALSVLAGEAAEGGLASLVTRYEMPTRGERALLPAFALLQVAVWPHAALALANGPLMAVRRVEYLELGGHAAIAASTREDLDLARLYASAARPVRLLRGADVASTRHYQRPLDALAAWRRMYYAYAGESLAVALAGITGLGLVLLGPPVLLAVALLAGDGAAAAGAAAGTALLVLLRAAVAVCERQPLVSLAWHPFTVLATLAAMAASVADGLVARPPVWRGGRLEGRLL